MPQLRLRSFISRRASQPRALPYVNKMLVNIGIVILIHTFGNILRYQKISLSQTRKKPVSLVSAPKQRKKIFYFIVLAVQVSLTPAHGSSQSTHPHHGHCTLHTMTPQDCIAIAASYLSVASINLFTHSSTSYSGRYPSTQSL